MNALYSRVDATWSLSKIDEELGRTPLEQASASPLGLWYKRISGIPLGELASEDLGTAIRQREHAIPVVREVVRRVRSGAARQMIELHDVVRTILHDSDLCANMADECQALVTAMKDVAEGGFPGFFELDSLDQEYLVARARECLKGCLLP